MVARGYPLRYAPEMNLPKNLREKAESAVTETDARFGIAEFVSHRLNAEYIPKAVENSISHHPGLNIEITKMEI